MHIHSILEKETNRIILINTFIVKDSSKLQKVADILEDASKQIISKHNGFISTRIHKSLDGTNVMSYIQWENKDAIEKMLNDPRVIIHMNDLASIAKVDRTLYELAYTEEKDTR
jgi:heme-degrading monooxygenase HmoA